MLNTYINRYSTYAWDIQSDCRQIHVSSESLQGDTCAHLNIAGIEYTGDAVINTVIEQAKFSVMFSDEYSFAEIEIHWFCRFNQTGSVGVLWLGSYDNNEDIEWKIESDCSAIHLVSTHFDTEEDFDFLRISDEHKYSGSTVVDQIIDTSSFVATFTSDRYGTASGFNVIWECYLDPIQRQNGMKFNSYAIGFCGSASIFAVRNLRFGQ